MSPRQKNRERQKLWKALRRVYDVVRHLARQRVPPNKSTAGIANVIVKMLQRFIADSGISEKQLENYPSRKHWIRFELIDARRQQETKARYRRKALRKRTKTAKPGTRAKAGKQTLEAPTPQRLYFGRYPRK